MRASPGDGLEQRKACRLFLPSSGLKYTSAIMGPSSGSFTTVSSTMELSNSAGKPSREALGGCASVAEVEVSEAEVDIVIARFVDLKSRLSRKTSPYDCAEAAMSGSCQVVRATARVEYLEGVANCTASAS